ncbi:MAG: S-methyl-5-thioribose-1-phosphate isomerase [Firmicutes bacterium]|nr:S-methyl-5-thioribose-1-phosphate isomerase [Bacillota bacterium]
MTELQSLPLNFRTVSMNESGTKLRFIDQTQLPNKIVWVEMDEIEQVWQAIKTLAVRGAPAIGVAAAIGLAVAAGNIKAQDYAEFYQQFCRMKAYLASARPTAVNLSWAMERMKRTVLLHKNYELRTVKAALLAEANAIAEEDVACCRAIGENGLPLLEGCRAVLTHCNAGRLAAVEYGTALAPIYLAKEKGRDIKVFADETRPLLQGARLTCWELQQAGVDVTLLCDNMAATVMAQGLVDAVIVGADRVAANGDVANKIGTSGVAILAEAFGIPFYVAAPGSTIDMACSTGREIVVEQRDPAEVSELWYQRPMAPAGINIFNPAFDVTPAKRITAIITNEGVVRQPLAENLAAMFGRKK